MTFMHMEPIPGHPQAADLDPSGNTHQTQILLVGDFDHDDLDELALAPAIGGTGTAEAAFHVMKYSRIAGRWEHLNNPSGYDVLTGPAGSAIKMAVAGDFDGDGAAEIAALPAGSNGLRVMKYLPDVHSWVHLGPAKDPAEFDVIFGPAGSAPDFILAADVDGDQADELILVANDGPGGQAARWTLKYNTATGRWTDIYGQQPTAPDWEIDAALRPLLFGLGADIDQDGREEVLLATGAVAANDSHLLCYRQGVPLQLQPWRLTSLNDAARFAVAGDFDHDGRIEIAAGLNDSAAQGSRVWVARYDPAALTWSPLGQIPGGDPAGASLQCATPLNGIMAAAAGDFDGDGADELILGAWATTCAAWAMKYHPADNTWRHMTPVPLLPGALQADIAVSPLSGPVAALAAGRFDRDAAAECAVRARAIPGLWVMDWVARPELPVILKGTITVVAGSLQPEVRFTSALSLAFTRYCRTAALKTTWSAMVSTEGPIIKLAPGSTPGTCDQITGALTLPAVLRSESIRLQLRPGQIWSGNVTLTTGTVQVGLQRFRGAPINWSTGAVTLVGSGTASTGQLTQGQPFLVTITGVLSPIPRAE